MKCSCLKEYHEDIEEMLQDSHKSHKSKEAKFDECRPSSTSSMQIN